MKLLLLIILSFASLNCLAQENSMYVFKGDLKSNHKKEAVPYASVLIQTTHFGVVSNEHGEFELHIPKEYWGDSIEILAIGYKTYTALIQNLIQIPYHSIFLTDTALVLNEVVVSNLSANDFILKALQHYDSNFPTIPYEMDCFYRSTVKENGIYVKLLESLFHAYDKGFTYKNIAKAVDIGKAYTRVSNDYTNKKAEIPWPLFRPLWLLAASNRARDKKTQLDNMKKSFYDVEFESTQYLDGKLIYVVSAVSKESVKEFAFDIKFYIREMDFAIVRLEFYVQKKLIYQKNNGIPLDLRLNITDMKIIYVFKEYNKKFYMHYIHNYVAYDWYGVPSGKLLTSCEEDGQMMMQNITYPPEGKPSFSPAPMRDLAGLFPTDYIPDIWKNDMVNEVPFDPKIKTDLEKEMSLEVQFKSHKGWAKQK